MTFAAGNNAAYAVIFTSIRPGNDSEYAEFADRVEHLATLEPGFVAIESVRDSEGRGITVSYWRDLESIRRFKELGDHLEAQERGRQSWYSRYTVSVCHIERAYSFESGTNLTR
jgi:heme-degrading monooxygenase HmoA